MKIYVAKYNIESIFENVLLYLNILRKSGFVLNECCFFDYNWDDSDTFISIGTVVNNGKELEKINESISIINFLISDKNSTIKFILQNTSIKEHSSFESFVDGNNITSKSKNSNRLIDFDIELNKLKNDYKKKFIGVCKYYDATLYLYSLKMYSECFLNSFKALELIAEDYFEMKKADLKLEIKDEAKIVVEKFAREYYFEDYDDEIHSKLTNNLTKQVINMGIRQKIKYLLTGVFKDDKILKKIDKVVEIRNKVVAHGNSTDMPEDIYEYIFLLMEIIEIVAPIYFLNNHYSKYKLKIHSKDIKRNFTYKPLKSILLGNPK